MKERKTKKNIQKKQYMRLLTKTLAISEESLVTILKIRLFHTKIKFGPFFFFHFSSLFPFSLFCFVFLFSFHSIYHLKLSTFCLWFLLTKPSKYNEQNMWDTVSVGQHSIIYLQQFCADTVCCRKHLPKAIDDRDEWRERVCASGATNVTQ